MFSCWSRQPAEWELPLTKLLSLGYGLLCLAVSYVVSKLGGSVLTASLTIFGAVGGPLLGVFTLGMFTTGANQRVSSRYPPRRRHRIHEQTKSKVSNG